MSEPLSLWNPGATRDAVLEFVARVTDPDTGLPPEERVAVFDNDGTLWCEKPVPIQLGLHPAPPRRDGRGRSRPA